MKRTPETLGTEINNVDLSVIPDQTWLDQAEQALAQTSQWSEWSELLTRINNEVVLTDETLTRWLWESIDFAKLALREDLPRTARESAYVTAVIMIRACDGYADLSHAIKIVRSTPEPLDYIRALFDSANEFETEAFWSFFGVILKILTQAKPNGLVA